MFWGSVNYTSHNFTGKVSIRTEYKFHINSLAADRGSDRATFGFSQIPYS